jgi:hypothetical protein
MPITHMMTSDPFATADSLGEEERDPAVPTGGRYRLPELILHPDRTVGTGGHLKGGRQRVTTMVKAIAEARALDLWHQRLLVVGMVVRPDLYDLACATWATMKDGDPKELKAALEDLADRILTAAGADVGATLGTAFHGFTEAQDLGLMHFARRIWHGKLKNYATGLQAQGLAVRQDYVERIVVVERYGLAGTLDRILEDLVAGVLRIGDLKSQKRFWTWLEISAQLAAYAMADAMWDRASRSFVQMPKVDQDSAVVAWMPVAHPDGLDAMGTAGQEDGVDFFQVDLAKGREALELCHRVDRMRSEAKSKAQTWGTLRPAPHLTAVEAYAQRLDGVETPAEGSAVWAEIQKRGLSMDPVLTQVALDVAARFAPVPS